MNKKTKLKYIQEVLEENLDMVWEDWIVYSYDTKEYRTVNMMLDFKPNCETPVRLSDKKKIGHMAYVTLNSKKFIVAIDGMKIDMSEHWQELLSQQLVTSSTK